MTWYLVLALISASTPHTTVMLQGPFPTKAKCQQQELGFSKGGCVMIKMVIAGILAAAVLETGGA
jgi:hypothetical protein